MKSALSITISFVVVSAMVATAKDAVAAGRHRDLLSTAGEVADRDKTGTSSFPESEAGSQVAENRPNASRGSFEAERTGLSECVLAAFRYLQQQLAT